MAWTRVAGLDEFGDRDLIGVVHGNVRIALCCVDGGVFAISDICPHLAAHLSEGELVEGHIECPAHFALFDIRTGQSAGGPTDATLKTWPARIEGQSVLVDLD
jgi:nitrite reductase/ring-hydroxylating ferredoxin subunit